MNHVSFGVEVGMSEMGDPLLQFKAAQREAWSHFAPLEAGTMVAAPKLVRHAGIGRGDRVLDVACGTGVVALTAARHGARVSGLDLTPELLARAREHSALTGDDVDWHEGDAEALPFPDGSFDVVVSQFGHMFAPRPAVVIGEMLRVLRPGGTIAFSTWPPELYVGSFFRLMASYAPPPPVDAVPPWAWGDPTFIRQQLTGLTAPLEFDRGTMLGPALSVPHHRAMIERNAGPVVKLVAMLAHAAPERLAAFRAELDALSGRYWADNQIRQDFLMTRAVKA